MAKLEEAGALSVAAVLVTLGRERALKLLAWFDPEEVAYLGEKAGALGSIDREKLGALTRTFERDFAAGTGLLNGGRSFGSILEETRGDEPDADTDDYEEPAEPPPDPWASIAAVPVADLAGFLATEGTALSAITAARLDSANAANLLAAFDAPHRAGVMAAMVSAKPSPVALQTALAVLREAFGLGTDAGGDREGETKLAAMLSGLDPADAEATLDNMRPLMDADAIARIVAQIMRFEDIEHFDLATRTVITEASDREEIALALADSSQPLRESLLEPMGQRARRMAESAIPPEGSGNQDRRNMARQTILATIRDLVDTGKITLPVDKD